MSAQTSGRASSSRASCRRSEHKRDAVSRSSWEGEDGQYEADHGCHVSCERQPWPLLVAALSPLRGGSVEGNRAQTAFFPSAESLISAHDILSWIKQEEQPYPWGPRDSMEGELGLDSGPSE